MTTPFDPSAHLARLLFNLCLSVPWEKYLVKPKVPPYSSQAPVPRPSDTPSQAIVRPGCTAADSALLNLGYLDGLSRGLGGWGVLRVGKERLEEGAKAARQLRQPELATEMEAIAAELPNIHDEASAANLAQKLRPVADRAWSMGASCKGALTPIDLAKIKTLAAGIAAEIY